MQNEQRPFRVWTSMSGVSGWVGWVHEEQDLGNFEGDEGVC